MPKLTQKSIKKWTEIKWFGEVYKYGRENLKIGNNLSPRWMLVLPDGQEIEFKASSPKIAQLTVFTKIG